MKEHFTKQKSPEDKGFSLVEIVVIIAIMIVLLAILTPFLLKYVENSRIQKDDSAMDEVCHGILYALSDSEIFDEAVSYSIPNNYVTYTDSSGVYAAKYVDEEFWAPDGSGEAVTITFNPDENGTYTLANGLVNDMTYGNGSVAETRVADGLKQCYFSEMGQQKLYHKVAQTIGETFSEKSATYQNSSYTVFITFDVVNGIKRADVYGEWNGTNLSPDCPASLGSGTSSYIEEEPEQTKNGGTTQSKFTNSDLTGSGSSSDTPPSYVSEKPVLEYIEDFDKASTTDARYVSTGVLGNFVKVKIDGVEVPSGQYTVSSPKTTVLIKNDYMKTLDVGMHMIEIVSLVDRHEESASGEFEVDTWIEFTLTSTTRSKIGYEDLIQEDGTIVLPYKFENGGKKYKLVEIGGYGLNGDNRLTHIVIPEGVRKLGNYSMSFCQNLKSVSIPNTVTSMGIQTFRNCTSLETVTIPDSVQTAGDWTFIDCYALKSVYIGKGLQSFGVRSWDECRSLETIIVDPANPYLRSVDNVLYSKDKTTLFVYPRQKTDKDYSVPDETIHIADYAFDTNQHLETIFTGNNTKDIGWMAFYECSSLKSITFGNNLERIGAQAFNRIIQQGGKIKNITIPASVYSVGYYAFGQGWSSGGYYRFYVENPNGWYNGSKEGDLATPVTGMDSPSSAARTFMCNSNHLTRYGDGANTHICTGGTVTCQNKAICKWCNQEYGELAACTGGAATCAQRAVCQWCNQEYGDIPPHSGGTATCQNKAVCSMCGQQYGSLGAHNISNGTCIVCGVSCLIFETAHNYPNSQNYVILGSWNYPTAKSVSITVEYETESASYDWVSIIEGHDYVAGNSYNQTKNYLNTSGHIVSTTGTNSSVKFGGNSRTTKTFTDVNMLQGTVIFRSDGSVQKWGAKVTITPNY